MILSAKLFKLLKNFEIEFVLSLKLVYCHHSQNVLRSLLSYVWKSTFIVTLFLPHVYLPVWILQTYTCVWHTDALGKPVPEGAQCVSWNCASVHQYATSVAELKCVHNVRVENYITHPSSSRLMQVWQS